MGDTINWGIFKRHFWGELLRHQQDRRGEADFLLCAHLAPIAHLGATDLDRPDPGLDCALRPMAMTHDAVAAIRQFQVLHMATKQSASAIST
jgi:hypothetical protein